MTPTHVLVPVEPTEAMIEAYNQRVCDYGMRHAMDPVKAWEAMIAAAPLPPEDVVEKLARALCWAEGLDPDERILCSYEDLHTVREGSYIPDIALFESRWRLKAKQARALLTIDGAHNTGDISAHD